MSSDASLKVLTPGRGYTAAMPGTGRVGSYSPHPAGTPFKEPSSSKDKYSDVSPSLDSLKRNCNKFCGRLSLQGHVQVQGNKFFRYVRLGCKRWDCPRCGPRKAKRVRHAITQKAIERDLRRLLTLTLNPSCCSARESVQHLRKSWGKFQTYLRRKYGPVSYIQVTEFQKSGYAHLHILVSHYLPQAWISKAWQAVGGGKIVDIRKIDVHRLGPYLTKYLTKDLFLGGFKRKQRRYTTSRDITLFVKTPSGEWCLIKASLEKLFHMAVTVGAQKRDEFGQLDEFLTSNEIQLPN